MFSNSGNKTKVLAWIVLILGIVGCLAGAITFFYIANDIPEAGVFGAVLLVGGPLISWMWSLPLYALGEAAALADEAKYEASEAKKISERNSEKLDIIKRLVTKK